MTAKVLFLVGSYPSEADPVTGIFHKTAVEALSRHGIEVDVLAPVPYDPSGLRYLAKRWRKYLATPKFEVCNGIRVHRPRYMHLPRGDYWYGWSRWWLARQAKRAVKAGMNVIHAHFAYPFGLVAAQVGRAMGIPSVLTLHGSDVNLTPFVSNLTRRLFRAAIEGPDVVIAVSQALADRTKLLAGRLPTVMPIGVDFRKFSPALEKGEARRRLGLPQAKFVCLFIGQLAVEKGVRELLVALRALEPREVIGVFVGDGPLRGEVEQVPNAAAAGAIANERVREYLAAADLFVLPSYSEGMPTVLVEAGAVGTPVLATAVGGIPELLADERGWMVPCRSSNELVKHIPDLIEHRDVLAFRAARLHDYVCRHYDADRNAALLAEIYESLRGNGPAFRPARLPT